MIVDLQGGYADKASGRKWTPDTRTVVFSTTKAVGAVCVAMLVDRGHITYDDKMSKIWPEFAQNGKENITIDWLMSHRVRVQYFFSEKYPFFRQDLQLSMSQSQSKTLRTLRR